MCFFTRMAQSCQLPGTTHQCLRVFFSSIWHNHVGRLEQLASVNLRFFLVFLVTDISCQPFDSLTCLSPVFFSYSGRPPGGHGVRTTKQADQVQADFKGMTLLTFSRQLRAGLIHNFDLSERSLSPVVEALGSMGCWNPGDLFDPRPDHPFCGKSFAEDWPVPWSWFFIHKYSRLRAYKILDYPQGTVLEHMSFLVTCSSKEHAADVEHRLHYLARENQTGPLRVPKRRKQEA